MRLEPAAPLSRVKHSTTEPLRSHIGRSDVQKSSILIVGTGVWKISSVARGFSSIKIDISDYLKSLISRVNEVYGVFFQ